jgi:hypothetical protein
MADTTNVDAIDFTGTPSDGADAGTVALRPELDGDIVEGEIVDEPPASRPPSVVAAVDEPARLNYQNLAASVHSAGQPALERQSMSPQLTVQNAQVSTATVRPSLAGKSRSPYSASSSRHP